MTRIRVLPTAVYTCIRRVWGRIFQKVIVKTDVCIGVGRQFALVRALEQNLISGFILNLPLFAQAFVEADGESAVTRLSEPGSASVLTKSRYL